MAGAAPYDQIRELCKRRGYSRKDSKEVSITRLAPGGAEARNRTSSNDDVIDTLVTIAGKTGRALVGVTENSDTPLRSQGRQCRVDVADKQVTKGTAYWRHPDLKSRWDVIQSSAAERVDNAISERIAEGRDRALG